MLFDINELPLKENYEKGKGSIIKMSASSYRISKSSIYYCSCRTYEQAYYVKEELNKCDWDKNKLPAILENYPIFYTKLLELYRYITRRDDTWWILSIPSTKSSTGSLQHITSSNVEALLHERDFLIEHDWDYNLLIDCINDSENPYFERVLPPYPERKVRNNRFRNPHKKELRLIQKLLLENPFRTQNDISKLTGISDMNIRNWLHNYDLDWVGFRSLVLSGEEDIFKVMKLKPLIFQPDLSPTKPHFKGHICKNRSKQNPYRILYKSQAYGVYPNFELAKKVRDELEAVDWDKNQLNSIRKKYGLKIYNYRNNIYPLKSGKYGIYKKIKGKQYSYGFYDSFEFAEKVRDELVNVDWDKNQLNMIIEKIKNGGIVV